MFLPDDGSDFIIALIYEHPQDEQRRTHGIVADVRMRAGAKQAIRALSQPNLPMRLNVVTESKAEALLAPPEVVAS